MYVRYGNYTHALDSAALVIQSDAIYDDTGETWERRERWSIAGELLAANTAALTTEINSLLAAYSVNGQTLVLLDNDGVTETAHKLTSAGTIGGVRVVQPPGFPTGTHGEYSTFRQFRVALEAITRINGAPNLIRWDETVTFQGTGGPRELIHEIRNGSPIRETVSIATPLFAIQQGQAIGRSNFPFFPAPLWPNDLNHPDTVKEYIHPRAVGSGLSRQFRDYGIRWSYPFQFTSPQSISQQTRRPT